MITFIEITISNREINIMDIFKTIKQYEPEPSLENLRLRLTYQLVLIENGYN